jgi:hypothetical protein
MEKLKRITAALSLILVLSVAALADEPPSPPCEPGIMQGPPCSAAQVVNDDPTAPGQTSTPPAVDTVDLISVAEAALIELLILW